jgi:hypothetical protein
MVSKITYEFHAASAQEMRNLGSVFAEVATFIASKNNDELGVDPVKIPIIALTAPQKSGKSTFLQAVFEKLQTCLQAQTSKEFWQLNENSDKKLAWYDCIVPSLKRQFQSYDVLLCGPHIDCWQMDGLELPQRKMKGLDFVEHPSVDLQKNAVAHIDIQGKGNAPRTVHVTMPQKLAENPAVKTALQPYIQKSWVA